MRMFSGLFQLILKNANGKRFCDGLKTIICMSCDILWVALRSTNHIST